MIESQGKSSVAEGWQAYLCDQCGAIIDSPYQIERVSCGCTQPVLTGPGSELVGLLHEIGARHTDQCDCASKAAQMNAWGPDRCREHRDEIIAWLKEAAWSQWFGAQAEIGWSAIQQPWFKLLNPIGSVVDEAIHRAEVSSGASVTYRQVHEQLERGVQASSDLLAALNITAPLVVFEEWMDRLCLGGQVACVVVSGQKHYGLPAKPVIMS